MISLANPASTSTIRLENHDDDDLTQTLGNDFETNRRYLAFSWWLLHRGWKDLMSEVQEAVKEVFGSLNPREDISLDKLSELTLQIRKKLEGHTEADRKNRKWLSYLLPPPEEEETLLEESGVLGVTEPSTAQTATTLRHLLDETADLIESPNFTRVLMHLNNEGFETLIQQCTADAFKTSPKQPETAPQSFTSVATVVPVAGSSEPKTKLANVLAVMARQAHVIGNGTTPPNLYLAAMEQNVRELEAFAAVIYSSNFDFELLGPESKTNPLEKETSGSDTVFIERGDASPMAGVEVLEESSTVPVGEDSTFETAWGKASSGPPTEAS